MKNILYKIVFLLSIHVCLISCSLEPELTSSYTEDVLWKSDENVELYINGFYPLIGQGYYTTSLEEDGYSDIVKMSLPYATQNVFVFGEMPISASSNVFDNWGWGYNWVTLCNRFLDGLKTKGEHLSDNMKIKAEAEIRFFRAHVYFMMARRYGASLVIFRNLPALGDKNHPLSTPDECWDFIEEDLDFAAGNLPLVAEKGRLTKGAALGLKARVMLYAERWEKAAQSAQDIFDLNLYDLYPDYAKLFTLRRSDGIDNKESILEFAFQYPELSYNYDYYYCPPGDNGFARATPTEDLVSQYQMADGTDFDWDNPVMAANPYEGREPRFYASILYNGAQWKGRTIESFVGGIDGWGLGGNTTSTGYYIRKTLDESLSSIRETDLVYYYMRFAELLLIYAEAKAMLGDLTSALVALNRVRRRAGFSQDVTATTLDQFMQLLRHERMIELAFEGHRFWDLRRWNLAKKVLDNTNMTGVKPTKMADGSYSYELIDCDNGKQRVYLDKYQRFPIPYTEIQSNNLVEQFPEWK